MPASGILKTVYAIIVTVVTAALGASFTHMHDWTMHVLPTDTSDAFGWVNAVISELTPLAGSLYLIHAHKHDAKTWPAWVMLSYGGTASAIGQIHAAGEDPSLGALIAALLPVTSAFILIKVLFMLLDQTKVVHEDLGLPAQEVVHHPVQEVFTPPVVNTSEPVMNAPSVNSVEVGHDQAVHTDVHAAQRACTPDVHTVPEPPVNTVEKPIVHKPKAPVHKAKNTTVNKPVNKPVNADREQLRRDVHELRKTNTVRAVADLLGISTGLVNKLHKEPLEPVNADTVNADAEQELAGVDMDAELAKLLAGNDKDES